MSDFSAGLQRPPSGCGVQGCLFAAVAIFVVLLLGLLVIGVFRFSEPPQGLPRPPMGMVEEASAVGRRWPVPAPRGLRPSGSDGAAPMPPLRRPGTDDRRPTTRRSSHA